ncbi:IS3 family transposase [Anaerococcus sp. Marseille-P9784]|uniref:IS3 family transposase n=1 Tax=Anaerococcus sp. Marseille-P9784 TaxID=2614127 RepID=UPI00124A2443|nr:IS3 family transposase [Anaerococcus sp. Marseille-P9784]
MRKKVSSLATGRRSRSKEKTKIILSLLEEHPGTKISEWITVAKLPKSSYYERKSKLENPIDKDKEIKEEIKLIVKASKGRYGYRRVNTALRNKGLIVNHKRVLRIMKQEGLLCTKFKTRSRKYSSYKGQVGKVAPNVVNRNFKASRPNQLWLTDVTEFRIKGREERLYLSPILDVYNSEIISYTLSHHPTIKLTNSMLDKAIKGISTKDNLVIHSDQGFHYQHSSWSSKLRKLNIRQSMSRKGNCLDNSPMENFFGLLKQEMYYGVEFKNYEQLRKEIESYIKWYNEDRIKAKLNGMSPVDYRLHSA